MIKSKVLDFLRRDKNGRGLDSVFLKTIVCHLFDFDTETKGKFDDLEKKEEISLSSSSNSNNIKIQNTKDNNFNHQTTGDNTYIHDKDTSSSIEEEPYHSKKTPAIIKNFAEKILSTYNDYCKHHVPFETFHLQLLRKSNEATTLKPFFDIFLPRVFNIEPITHQYEEAKKDGDNKNRSHNNSQLNNMDSDKKIWFHELKKEYNLIFNASNDIYFTDLYKETSQSIFYFLANYFLTATDIR
ncbi:904_t:CDS:2 [Entrophospora sp. SA101]|nr:904_t:CDS:2 [Entrophospora sp. SA101]